MRKIFVIALILLAPLSVFGQKFGQFNSSDIILLMPEYTNAQNELQTLRQQYAEEMKYLEDEFIKKRDEYQAQASTLPENIKVRREQELQESQQKASQFYNDCEINLQKKSEELMDGISTKLRKVIQEVGEEGAYVCIFDAGGGAVPYISSTLTTDVTEPIKAKLGIK